MSDTIYVAPTGALYLETYEYPTNQVGTIGVRLRSLTDRSDTIARTTAGIAFDATTGAHWIDTLLAPVGLGSYDAIFDIGEAPPWPTQRVTVVGTPPFTPPTPSGAALTSVANAQAWLRRNHVTGQAATDDTSLLTIAINGVSKAISRYTSREFVDPTGNNADLARTFNYDGSGFLDFAPYDLRSITSVTLGGSALVTSTGVGDNDYIAEPRNKTLDGTYLYLTMRSFYQLRARYSIFSPVLPNRDVVVTGKWGMTAVPADVELACLIAVADLYRNPEQVSNRGSGDFTMSELAVNPGSEESLPPGARRLLDSFVRPKVA